MIKSLSIYLTIGLIMGSNGTSNKSVKITLTNSLLEIATKNISIYWKEIKNKAHLLFKQDTVENKIKDGM